MSSVITDWRIFVIDRTQIVYKFKDGHILSIVRLDYMNHDTTLEGWILSDGETKLPEDFPCLHPEYLEGGEAHADIVNRMSKRCGGIVNIGFSPSEVQSNG
jgi:hypothetical protein